MDFALDNQQWLICHKTKTNTQTKLQFNGISIPFELFKDQI